MYNDNMSTNGRSIHRHLVTTSDPRRAALWDRIFGCEALPVKHHTPRWQERESGVGQELAYDLDTARLTPMQRARFASHLARIERRSYAATSAEVNGGRPFPIKASRDIQVTEPAEQMPSLASFLQQLGRNVPRPLFRFGW